MAFPRACIAARDRRRPERLGTARSLGASICAPLYSSQCGPLASAVARACQLPALVSGGGLPDLNGAFSATNETL